MTDPVEMINSIGDRTSQMDEVYRQGVSSFLEIQATLRRVDQEMALIFPEDYLETNTMSKAGIPASAIKAIGRWLLVRLAVVVGLWIAGALAAWWWFS